MVILSIDPAWGKDMAYAVFWDGKLRDGGKTKNLCNLGLEMQARVLPLGYVVTEDPYPGGNIKIYSYRGQVHTLKTLCFAVGKIIQLAESLGAEYELIRPVKWKTFYGLVKNTPAAIQKEIREKITGIKDDEDLQDAIMIGRYFIDHKLVIKKS